MTRLAITGGRLVDPANGVDAPGDLFVANGRIVSAGRRPDGFAADQAIDARGCLVCPGLVDLCARLREPGQEHKATIASEAAAAVRGGVTTLCLPPDTIPVIDEPSVVELIRRRCEAAEAAKVLVVGALTRGLRGEALSEMAALKRAGCVAVGNAMMPISNTLVMRRAMEYAGTYDLRVMLFACDPWLAGSGCAHEGITATRLGLPGIPASAETAILARDLALAEEIGIHAHFGRITSARAVQLVARARQEGLPVTADVAAHQLHLTDDDVAEFNSLCHVIPPLRTDADRLGLRRGLVDGHLSAICSDHQPHEEDAKLGPFVGTEPGISALETLLPLSLKLREVDLPLATVIERLTWGPAQILGIEAGTLSAGAPADVCVVDTDVLTTFDASAMTSRGHNSPFSGWTLPGRVTHTLVDGRIVFEARRV